MKRAVELALKSAGWTIPDSAAKERLRNIKRCVAIYPHTSFWDFCMYVAFTYLDKEIGSRCCALVNSRFTSKFEFLKKFGAIESTRRETKNGGLIDKLYNELSGREEFLFLISPKGSMESHHEWRSGFYALAKRLNCPIVPLGFDFEKRIVIIKEPYDVSNMTLEEAIATGKERLASIIPYNPDRAEYPLDDHNYNQIGMVSPLLWAAFVLIVAIILIVICWWLGNKFGRRAR